jgi:putative ABC transport system permease protein
MTNLHPILAALRRHRLATALIALEIALACAVLCNACFLIAGRIRAMHVQSGVDEASLAIIKLTGFEGSQASDLNARVLSALRSVVGVQSATVTNTAPFGEKLSTGGVITGKEPGASRAVVDFYIGGPGTFHAMGLRLLAGRLLQPDEYRTFTSFVPDDASVLISHSLAQHLWPNQDPLGRELWCDRLHFRVVGVLDHLARPNPGAFAQDRAEWTVFVGGVSGPGLTGTYLLKADPAQLPRVLRDAKEAVMRAAPDAVLDQEYSRMLKDLRDSRFQQDRAMAGMLVGIIVALLLVTALGIVGLASFWVQQRRKQIGIRRAIGATRRDILRYFQTENFLIVSGGIAIGMVLAFVLNVMLMKFYELPRLPLYYLPVGAVVLWTLGQLAVLGPALRAASVPPVVATRSV